MKIILVLGNKLDSDGVVPEEFKAKINKGVEILKKIRESGKDARLVIAGGVTRSGCQAEAEAGKCVVPQDLWPLCLVEARSKSTRENIKFTKDLLLPQEKSQIEEVIVVSTAPHVFRTRFLFWMEWREVYDQLSFQSIQGFDSVWSYFMHTIFFVLTVIDPKERFFFPIQRWWYKGGK